MINVSRIKILIGVVYYLVVAIAIYVMSFELEWKTIIAVFFLTAVVAIKVALSLAIDEIVEEYNAKKN